nr:reverse transcriptase domain-containing protein [Tanacetum cinerariifolium]
MATLTDMMTKLVSANTASSSGSGTLPDNTVTNLKEELKGITTRSGVTYQGPKTPFPSKQGTKPVAPVSALMPNLKPSIPYPSRRDNEKRHDQANEQIEKFYEIFKETSFEISFTDALILMPKFASTLKSLIGNKEKLSEMARTMMNEHCSTVILNKLPRKLGDPRKFLIPCEFSRMDEFLALADLGACINLMPLSVWEGLSLPELTPTCMTLELADHSVLKPIGIAKDVSFKVGVFHFPADFVLTLRIRNEAITYNLDQTVRYSANYNQMTANKIGVVESACEEYSQEVLGFLNVTASGTPTPQNDPIVSATSPTLTPFWDSDFLLFEEADAFLVHTDHFALKYLFAKKDAKARLLRWVLLLQEFDFKVLDTKGAENLAADHLSRLENSYENVLDPKEINETFPLETLSMVTFRGDSSAPCGQVEVSNRGLKRILERTIGENRASWSDKLYDALWAFRTTYKTSIGCTPYKLVYEKACHLPIELEHKAYWALKQANFDLTVVGDHRKIQLNELNEIRNQAYENSLIYKEKTKKIHDSKINNRVFNVGDRVLLFNSRLKIFSGKLKTHWSGPFTITKVFPYGTVELSQANGPNFKVNGHRIKHYFGGDVPQLVVPDL